MRSVRFFDGGMLRDGVLEAGPDGGIRLRTEPGDAPALDGIVTGRFTDHHVHLQLVDHTLLAGSRLGRVVDLGANPDWIRAAARHDSGDPRGLPRDARVPGEARHDSPEVRQPIVEYAGAFVTAPGGYPSDRAWAPEGSVCEIADAAAATAAVGELAAAGASVIKVVAHSEAGPVLDDGSFRAVVAAAHAQGLPVVAHAEGAGQAQRAARLGADRLAHAPFTEPLSDAEIAEQAASLSWISTLAVHDDDARAIAIDNVRRFVRAGGTLLYGTDMGNGDTPVDLRETEIDALREAGVDGITLLRALGPLSPIDAGSPLLFLPAGDPALARILTPPIWRPDMTESLEDEHRRVAGVLAPDLLSEARRLDAADPLAHHLAAFADAPGVTAYLDGNSLGRPLKNLPERIGAFIREDWGTRLIRSWDEQWMRLPMDLGDRIASVALGAAAGQTLVADSTSVMLYKLMRAAVAARPGRSEIVIEAGNFPTDRFIAAGVAEETGTILRWIEPDPISGVTAADVSAAVSERTALVVLSHVDYRSGALADMPAITKTVHDAGALILWDLCHSVGSVPMQLDAWSVDMAVGCTYKYLNGGPGSPAFAYLRAEHHGAITQPIHGWFGAADIFAMGPEYASAAGIRQLLSGTPPVLGMLAMQGMLDLIEEAGMTAVRAKSISLTDFAVRAYDELLAPLGVRLLTTRDAARRGGHITIGHDTFQEVTQRLWNDGIIPDFRFPDGIRLGLSPLSTSHEETLRGIVAVKEALA